MAPLEVVIYVGLWAALILLLKLLERRPQGRETRGGDASPNWASPDSETDPVCGKTVRTRWAKPSVHAGVIYYFCSRDCREIFEAAPEFYTGAGEAKSQIEEYSHV